MTNLFFITLLIAARAAASLSAAALALAAAALLAEVTLLGTALDAALRGAAHAATAFVVVGTIGRAAAFTAAFASALRRMATGVRLVSLAAIGLVFVVVVRNLVAIATLRAAAGTLALTRILIGIIARRAPASGIALLVAAGVALTLLPLLALLIRLLIVFVLPCHDGLH